MFLKHVCGIDDRFGHDRCQMGMLVPKESLKSIKIGERVHGPFELHRSCHDLNAGDPHVRSHRTTASFETVASPALIAAHRRSSSATSSVDSASREVASAVISATSSRTDKPRSAALASSAIAVRSSTSMTRLGAFINRQPRTRIGSYDFARLRSWKLAGRAPGINPGLDLGDGAPCPFELLQSPDVFLHIWPVDVDYRIEQSTASATTAAASCPFLAARVSIRASVSGSRSRMRRTVLMERAPFKSIIQKAPQLP